MLQAGHKLDQHLASLRHHNDAFISQFRDTHVRLVVLLSTTLWNDPQLLLWLLLHKWNVNFLIRVPFLCARRTVFIQRCACRLQGKLLIR